ncbi:MAG: hypothetical protein HKN09_07450, partial [Saprospiraceae bacterium]|nr:hypothetical protein [Saprospiraceae bacterium]
MKLAYNLFATILLICALAVSSFGQLVPNNCDASGEVGPNLLANGGFELNAPGQVAAGGFENTGGWNFFGAGFNNYIENPPNPFSPCAPKDPAARGGSQLFKVFGQFNGGFNASGAFSNPINVIPGETYVASVWALSPSEIECPIDHIADGILAELHIEFLDAMGNLVEFTTSDQFDAAKATGGYRQLNTVAVAPEGAAQVQINLLFFQFNASQGGAVYFDDAFLGLKEDGTAGALTCNNDITVTVNGSCASDVTVDMFVEGNVNELYYDFSIANSVGTPVDINDLAPWIGTELTYTVHDLCSDNTCWGNITFEDKTPPTVECDCPVGGETGIGDYSEDCTLTCWELPLLKEKYWDRLRDN